MENISERFALVARWTSEQCGRATTFAAAIGIIVLWGLTGPIFGFSDTWQLIINTGTTIVTFLMVFLLQHTQNRDTLALQVKLDEIVKALPAARDEVAGAEELPEEELRRLRKTGAPTKERGVRRA